jgi:hypothetical protein
MCACPPQRRTPGRRSRRRHEEKKRKGGLHVSMRLVTVARHSYTFARLGPFALLCPRPLQIEIGFLILYPQVPQ